MKPNSIEEASEAIGAYQHLFASCGRSKSAIKAPEKYTNLDMSSFSGILEYEPSEYTFTALAGTKLDDIDSMLAENKQYKKALDASGRAYILAIFNKNNQLANDIKERQKFYKSNKPYRERY